MPSEQPREGTRVDALAEALFRAQNSESEWPPMRWSNVGNEYLADAWREKARNLLRRLELLPSEPAQSQPREGTRVCEHAHEGNICPICEPTQPQPRGEEAPVDPALYRQCEDSGHPPISRDQGCNCGFRPAPPRGEGDDLAARLDALADAPVEFAYSARDAYRYAARLARASTHPEQSARVTGEQALALAGWIEGNVWQDSTVDVADLLRVLGGFE